MDKTLLKLALDTYNGATGNFSNEDANETLRAKLVALVGSVDPSFKTMRRNKIEVFEIIEEALDVLVAQGITTQFDEFAEVKNLAWGDTNRFTLKQDKLFDIATVTDGNGVLRRQRLDSGSITVDTYTKAVKIYEEFHRFLAGRINWQEMVNNVAASYIADLKTGIYNAVYNSYGTLVPPYAVTGVYAEDDLFDLVDHVEAANNGMKAEIVGTRKALRRVAPALISDNMKDAKNDIGFYKMVNGTNLRLIPNAHKPGTTNWAINDDFLMVLPTNGEKFVKIVIEGDAIIDDTQNKADMSMEYSFIKRAGLAVVATKKYGIYRIS